MKTGRRSFRVRATRDEIVLDDSDCVTGWRTRRHHCQVVNAFQVLKCPRPVPSWADPRTEGAGVAGNVSKALTSSCESLKEDSDCWMIDVYLQSYEIDKPGS